MPNYIKYIRRMVGHKRILMNFTLAAIFNEKGEIFLQKRGDNGKWGLPGGAMELGETLNEAVIREVKEETGFKIKPESLIGIYTGRKYWKLYMNGDKTQPVSFLFNAKIVGGRLDYGTDGETLELRYFSKNNLPEISSRGFKDMIRDAFAKKRNLWS